MNPLAMTDWLPQISLLHIVWAGLIVLTVWLLVMLRTSWGQSEPLQKCILLSLLAHLLLGIYATTVPVVDSHGGTPRTEEPIKVSQVELSGEDDTPVAASNPWDQLPQAVALPARPPELEPPRANELATVQRSTKQFTETVPSTLPQTEQQLPEVPLPQPEQIEHTATPEAAPVAEVKVKPEVVEAKPVEVTREAPKVLETVEPSQPLELKAPTTERSPPMGSEPMPVPDLPQENFPQPALPEAEIPISLNTVSLPSASAPVGPLTVTPPLGVVPPIASVPKRRTEWEPSSSANLVRPRSTPEGVGNENNPLTDVGLAIIHPPSVRIRASDTPAPVLELPTKSIPAPPVTSSVPRDITELPLPPIYQLRVAPDRAKVIEENGGTVRTEKAVQAALKWLADHQSADGRWNAKLHGAGRETLVLGRDRHKAGAQADTGVTGLALLAFLGAGHTHQRGEYQTQVLQGIRYLINIQGADGNLGGEAEVFSFMYCHGMASFALSECFAMTHDPQLQEPVRRAIAYILRSQHTGGGWRYQPGDPGDTSVLGWQLMALKSAEQGGITMPQSTKAGMVRYLQSVAQGRAGGLASYRPGEQVSRTMSAEALTCWQILGMSRNNPASDEAGNYLLQDLPSPRSTNYYYWYYGTLSMYQLGGSYWETWNNSLTRQLLDQQKTTGDLAGSWEPNDTWGGHGGRVYSTAMGALCLEVYYRFLPIYKELPPFRSEFTPSHR